MSVTVLVPSYNHAPFIERTLRSIFRQTLPPKKMIVIDDGSKDESATIIERVLKDCPLEFEFIKRENRGLCKTLIEGFAKSSGNYFAYIGSDDLWLPDFLASRIALLEKRPQAVLAYGHAYLIDEQDAIIDSTEDWSEYADGNPLSMLLYPIIPTSASVVYRRSALEKRAWNQESILEDYELYLRLSAIGEFALDKKILSAWRIHGYNTSADFPLMMKEWLVSQERVADEIGLSEEKLKEVQTKLKFRCVADFIRNGQKKEAWKMFRENRRGATSVMDAGKMFLRFLIPTKVFQAKKEAVAKKYIKEKGILRY